MLDRLRGYPLGRAERREIILSTLDRDPGWQSTWEVTDALDRAATDKVPSRRAVARDMRVLTRTNLVKVMDAHIEHVDNVRYYAITNEGRAKVG